MKNYIIIAIIVVLVISGYVILQNNQKPQIADMQEIKVTDNLLTKNKLLCAPDSTDDTPNCFSLNSVKTIEVGDKEIPIPIYEYRDKKYDFIRSGSAGKCPPDDSNPEEIVIFDKLDKSTVPYSGKARIAYYCSSVNRFWVYEFDDRKYPYPYWYGSFEGYPTK